MNFEKYVQSYCEKNNIELVISEKTRVNSYSIKCNGFFDANVPIDFKKEHILGIEKYVENNLFLDSRAVLAYSVGEKSEEEILGLLAHEFAHVNQYIEFSNLWIDSSKFLIWDEYFKSEKFKLSKVKKVWEQIVKLEVDCEKRVLDLIDKFNLPINKERYIQKANAYLFFYTYAFLYRKWYNKAPYEVENIVKLMPKTIMDMDFYVDLENKEIKSKEKHFQQCFV